MFKLISNFFSYFHFRRDKTLTKQSRGTSSYDLLGSNNKIVVFDAQGERTLKKRETVPGLSITIEGDDNIIRIPKNANFRDCEFRLISNNANIEILSNKKISNLFIFCAHGNYQKVFIDEETTIGGCALFLDEENATVLVGRDCMFSREIIILASDGHAIMDESTREVLNKIKKPVVIGNHCWIGYRANISKNAILPDNTIVGLSSCVTKEYQDKNTILAGNPAKIIKRGVVWDRKTAAQSLAMKQIQK